MSEIQRFGDNGEVRLKPDGSIDEIVTEASYVHIERMDSGVWWMRITHPTAGNLVVRFLSAAGIRCVAESEDGGAVSAGFKRRAGKRRVG